MDYTKIISDLLGGVTGNPVLSFLLTLAMLVVATVRGVVKRLTKVMDTRAKQGSDDPIATGVGNTLTARAVRKLLKQAKTEEERQVLAQLMMALGPSRARPRSIEVIPDDNAEQEREEPPPELISPDGSVATPEPPATETGQQ